jgi:hypothetical protein
MEVPASLRLAHFWQIRDLFVLPTHQRHRSRSCAPRVHPSGCDRVGSAAASDSGYTLIKGYRSLMLPLSPELR